MSKTFAELGNPFPLFDAPITDAADYMGLGACSLCATPKQHCFELGIGAALMVTCPKCDTENGLDAADRADAPCRQCGSSLTFPDINGEIFACYSCLRAGKAAITKDTELGMVSWEQAFEGVTHGVPGLNRTDFEMVPTESDWIGARLPRESMYELLRTPNYLTIQGERWQFCCKTPMVFIGTWTREDFKRRAPAGDGRRYFEQVVQNPVPGLWEDALHDVTGVYVFRCGKCSRITANWDLA
jgi:uncharacterized protein CbrC (UPF0167 family)